MISDSPPDRELEWTDEGIQSSKNIINRIERYFKNKQTVISDESIKSVERYVFEIEKNILNFSLNKCVANIYTLFNALEKSNIYLSDSKISGKILICLYPILPSLSAKIYKNLFHTEIETTTWPGVDKNLLIDNQLDLPIQINGKFTSTISTEKGYEEDHLLKAIYELDKIKNRLLNKKVRKVINVQNKIINIITD